MSSRSRYVVYTAIFGNYLSEIPDAPEHCDGVDFFCFTDDPKITARNWSKILVDDVYSNPVIANRRYKMLPHLYFKDYEWSLYIDSNVKILECPVSLFDFYKDLGRSCYFPKHYLRDCVYDEAVACISLNRGNFKEVLRQISSYRAEGMPRHFGLTENNIILRKNCDSDLAAMMEKWWAEFEKYSSFRDQLSLPYVIWKAGAEVGYMVESARNNNLFFKYKIHPMAVGKGFVYKSMFFLVIKLRKLFARILIGV